jgi:hypothetical protein
VSAYEGLGSYSWNLEEYDTARSNSLGFMTNWDLSGMSLRTVFAHSLCTLPIKWISSLRSAAHRHVHALRRALLAI